MSAHIESLRKHSPGRCLGPVSRAASGLPSLPGSGLATSVPVGRTLGCPAPLEPAMCPPAFSMAALGLHVKPPFNMDGAPGHAQRS